MNVVDIFEDISMIRTHSDGALHEHQIDAATPKMHHQGSGMLTAQML